MATTFDFEELADFWITTFLADFLLPRAIGRGEWGAVSTVNNGGFRVSFSFLAFFFFFTTVTFLVVFGAAEASIGLYPRINEHSMKIEIIFLVI